MNSCLECGADNAEDVLYCVKCGKRLAPPQPPPESWRYNTEDLGGPRPVQPIPPAYQPPPPYANRPPYAPEQGYETRQGQAQRQGYAPPQGYGAPQQQQNVRPYAPPALYQPPTPAPYPPAPAQGTSNSSLPQLGMTLAVVVACIVVLGLVPCLGWLNWFAIIFGKVSLVMCIIGVATEKDPSRRSKAVVGLVLLCVALGVAVFRLTLSLIFGGGCL